MPRSSGGSSGVPGRLRDTKRAEWVDGPGPGFGHTLPLQNRFPPGGLLHLGAVEGQTRCELPLHTGSC